MARYPEAEVLLLEAHKELTGKQVNISKRYQRELAEVIPAIVNLYKPWGKEEQAARWRRENEAASAPGAQGSSVSR
jgi:hypothetical protein